MPKEKPDFKKHTSFENRLLILGFGAIGQCILPLILRHLKITPSQITIIEAGDHSGLLNDYSGKINYIPNVEIDENNFKEIFSQYLKAGDFLVNVSVNINST